jgi:putative ubiquitin-RnfH superfamily antitoxin RatB of RatAB toxin-antitoxin module
MGPVDGQPLMLRVSVAWAPPGEPACERALSLPAGSTVADALLAAGLQAQALATVAVWNHRATPEQALRDGDRVECLRPLRADPKEARRQRQAQHQDTLRQRRAMEKARQASRARQTPSSKA